jgi:type II secretory pathway pseudopilin PulG
MTDKAAMDPAKTGDGQARSGQAGMSLVELMLALSASAVLVGSLLSGVVRLNGQRQLREERILALHACRNVLEDLRRGDLDAVRDANGRGFAVAGVRGTGSGLSPVSGDADGLPGSITVSPERTFGTDVLYRVTAAVDWARSRGRARVHLTTLMGARR